LGGPFDRERRESATWWVERCHLSASPPRHPAVPFADPEQPEAPIAGANTQQESRGSGGGRQGTDATKRPPPPAPVRSLRKLAPRLGIATAGATSSAEVLPSPREAISFWGRRPAQVRRLQPRRISISRVLPPALRAVVGGCQGEVEVAAG
jgi:hypothetical protein